MNEDRGPRCGHQWKDGWGEHECSMFVSLHSERNHMCNCDARIRVTESDNPNLPKKEAS